MHEPLYLQCASPKWLLRVFACVVQVLDLMGEMSVLAKEVSLFPKDVTNGGLFVRDPGPAS